jgi:DnaK suppressor protein
LSAQQLERLRRSLLHRLTGIYRAVRADLRDSTVRHLFGQDEPRDEADESLRLQIRDLRLSLDEREARLAQAIEEALGRMARGEFGICVDCGLPIEPARLRLVPWTVRCADDQQALEAATHARAPTL